MNQYEWTNETESLLGEFILRHIREGSTISSGCEEVAAKLNITKEECESHWENHVAPSYSNAIKVAKKKRQEKEPERNQFEIGFGDYINYLRLEQDISITKLASLVGVEDTYIKEIEKGKIPSKEILKSLSLYLKTSYANLLFQAGYVEPQDLFMMNATKTIEGEEAEAVQPMTKKEEFLLDWLTEMQDAPLEQIKKIRAIWEIMK